MQQSHQSKFRLKVQVASERVKTAINISGIILLKISENGIAFRNNPFIIIRKYLNGFITVKYWKNKGIFSTGEIYPDNKIAGI